MPDPELLLGIDTGGTFIDIVVAEAGGDVLAAVKQSGSDDLVASILTGVGKALDAAHGTAADVVRVVYGTTMATNLVLEHKGARIAAVLTDGFQDMPAIGRETRGGRAVYDLRYVKADHLVEPEACFGLPGRIDAAGREVSPFDPRAAAAIVDQVASGGFDAVAVCLMSSYADPGHEEAFLEVLRRRLPEVYVALSSRIWPEFREYERLTTTTVSAYIGPHVATHLRALADGLDGIGITAWVEVMLSHGGTGSIASVIERPVGILESGPAAGLLGASSVAAQLEVEGAIAFDMGGTTAKAGVTLGGRPVVTSEFHVGGSASAASRHDGQGLPVRVPVVDLAEVGAGGGSIAHVDAWGAVKVGPESAGARPGPAAYGRGGDRPTITDADLTLGLLGSASLARSDVDLSAEAAARAIEEHVARPMSTDLVTAARAMDDVANAKMAEAIHLVTVARGVDARHMTLVGFGGAGPSHVVALAESFGIGDVVIPRYAGVMSALGMLSADLVDESMSTTLAPLEAVDGAELTEQLGHMRAAALAGFAEQGIATEGHQVAASLDLRFRHQSHELTVEVSTSDGALDVEEIARSFRKRSAERFGVVSDDAVELVGIRVRLVIPRPKVDLPALEGHDDRRTARSREVHYWGGHGSHAAVVHPIEDLAPGTRVEGPAVIEDRFASVALPPSWGLVVDRRGHLRLSPRDPSTNDQPEPSGGNHP